MATVTECAFHITLKAADRIHQLELWPQFRMMLENLHETLPGLRSLHVDLGYAYGEDHPTVIIHAYTDESDPDDAGRAEGSFSWLWGRWAVKTFPAEVIQHFCLFHLPGMDPPTHER